MQQLVTRRQCVYVSEKEERRKKCEITDQYRAVREEKQSSVQKKRKRFFDRITSIELILMDLSVVGNDVSLKADIGSVRERVPVPCLR